jgi:hypothetical protein
MKTITQKVCLRTSVFSGLSRKILVCIFIFGLSLTAFAQKDAVRIGTVAGFYESLKTTDASKSLRTEKSGDLVVHSSQKKGTKELITGKVSGREKSIVHLTFSGSEVNGKIIIPEEKKAYRYFSEKGIVYSVPENIEDAICVEYETAPTASAPAVAQAPPPSSYVYNLQSLPGATAVVMLDFDGHDASGSWWGNIVGLPADVTESAIVEAWNTMSDDFRPFNLNITTNEAIYQAAPTNRRMRCIFTPTTDAYPGSGGVAFIGVFTTGGELAPCWVFNLGDGKLMGETGSHEIGHTMGLVHDGRELPGGIHEEYYGGHDDWAPIMGVSFSPPVSHWSKGEYQYANNQEDDIAIIASSTNGFGFRADAQGNSLPAAALLNVQSNGTVDGSQNYGIIADQQDSDYFKFTTTTSGAVNLVIQPALVWPNLDAEVSLLNDQGTVIVQSNPTKIAACSLSAAISAGTYYIRIVGSGYGASPTVGYSSYSSIGEYRISGTVPTTTSTFGISGPSCVLPGIPYTLTLNPEFGNPTNISWWINGDATIQQNPNDPKIATITFSSYNSASLTLTAGVTYSTAPWYTTYQKAIQFGGCSPSSQRAGDAGEELQSSIVQVQLFDLHGREILNERTEDPQTFIREKNMSAGLYLMRISDENGSYVVKVVK